MVVTICQYGQNSVRISVSGSINNACFTLEFRVMLEFYVEEIWNQCFRIHGLPDFGFFVSGRCSLNHLLATSFTSSQRAATQDMTRSSFTSSGLTIKDVPIIDTLGQPQVPFLQIGIEGFNFGPVG